MLSRLYWILNICRCCNRKLKEGRRIKCYYCDSTVCFDCITRDACMRCNLDLKY